MHRLVCDVSNLFYRCISAQLAKSPGDIELSAGLGLHSCLVILKKYFELVKPDELAVFFEGRNNWRKTYTRSEECYSKRLYKGNRVADPKMAVLFEVLQAFEMLIREHTAITVVANPVLEGDDCCAAYANHYANLGDTVTILSGDKDFVQLLGNPNIKLLNPDKGVYRTLVDVCGVDNAGYFMFEKCFRGDSGDNVMSALPRVRADKLKKAFGVNGPADDLLLNNLFNQNWEFCDPETGAARTMNVGQLFNENKILMDLQAQPPEIKEIMQQAVQDAVTNKGKFNLFKFMAFLGKYELREIANNSASFAKMFSGTGFNSVSTTTTQIKTAPEKRGLQF